MSVKTHTLRIAAALAVVAILSLGLAGSALATPSFTSVSPASASDGDGASFELTIYGDGFSEMIGSPSAVRLQMSDPPFDSIDARNPQVHTLMGGDNITCDVRTYAKTPGTYSVEIDYYSLIDQLTPDTGYVPNAFTVTSMTSTPSNLYISSVSPTQATAGGPAFTLTVNGSGFATGAMPAVVNWNGQALVTTGGTDNPTAVLTAAVPANLIATPGAASITVTNPLMGGDVTSEPINFSVVSAGPVLTGFTPILGAVGTAVTLTGSGFTGATKVAFNGTPAAVFTAVSATQITATVPAAATTARSP